MEDKVYKLIASQLLRIESCKKINNEKSMENIEEAIDILEHIEKQYLPHGSGIDCGCKINIEKSNSNKIVIDFSFHHMDENGYYDGWTDHSIIITPSLYFDYDMKITGKNRNYVKDYLTENFSSHLDQIKTI